VSASSSFASASARFAAVSRPFASRSRRCASFSAFAAAATASAAASVARASFARAISTSCPAPTSARAYSGAAAIAVDFSSSIPAIAASDAAPLVAAFAFCTFMYAAAIVSNDLAARSASVVASFSEAARRSSRARLTASARSRTRAAIRSMRSWNSWTPCFARSKNTPTATCVAAKTAPIAPSVLNDSKTPTIAFPHFPASPAMPPSAAPSEPHTFCAAFPALVTASGMRAIFDVTRSSSHALNLRWISAPVMCYTSSMVTPQSMESCAALGAACADGDRRKGRPMFRFGRTLPWYVELALVLAAGPVAFKIAVAVFTWLGI